MPSGGDIFERLNDSPDDSEGSSIFKKFGGIVTLGLIGLILIGAGVLVFKFAGNFDNDVEIVSVEPQEVSKDVKSVVVDIEGAVVKPGVFELPVGSRINDLLIAAGGLSARADREWVAKNINLAKVLTDGMKVYIPKAGENIGGQIAGAAKEEGREAAININEATLAQLDTLEGIGQKRAQDIIDGRPYNSIEELVTKKVISQSVFEKIKDKIIVN